MNLISKWFQELNYLLWLKPVRDAFWNFWAYFIVILIWIITSSILAKNISSEEYGMLGLVTTIIWMIAWFIWFGFFEWYSLVLLKEEKKEKQRELIWTWVLILIALSWIFFIATLVLIPLIHLIYDNISITKAILIINFVSCFSLANIFLIYTTKYLGKMKWQAFYSLLQPIFYLTGLVLLLHYEILSFQYALVSTYISFIISAIIMISYMKPTFKNLKTNLWKVKKMQKDQGWHIYVWQSFERATFKLDNIILWFFNLSHVAFYNLWNIFTSPILAFSSKLTDSLVKNLDKQNKIPKKVFIYNFLWWLICSIIIIFSAKYIILLLWTSEYLMILDFLWMFLILSLSVINSLIIQAFLKIKNMNKQLKKAYYFKWLINLIWNIILIPIIWIKWAILTSIIWSLTALLIWIKYYIDLTNNKI